MPLCASDPAQWNSMTSASWTNSQTGHPTSALFLQPCSASGAESAWLRWRAIRCGTTDTVRGLYCIGGSDHRLFDKREAFSNHKHARIYPAFSIISLTGAATGANGPILSYRVCKMRNKNWKSTFICWFLTQKRVSIIIRLSHLDDSAVFRQIFFSAHARIPQQAEVPMPIYT